MHYVFNVFISILMTHFKMYLLYINLYIYYIYIYKNQLLYNNEKNDSIKIIFIKKEKGRKINYMIRKCAKIKI